MIATLLLAALATGRRLAPLRFAVDLARRLRGGDDLGAARRGDRAAIGRFYDAHVDGLHAFVIHRVGGDRALAEDVVQETFTLALARDADYDAARGSVASWLIVLSRNVIRDHLRAHHRSDRLHAAGEQLDATLAQSFAALAEHPLARELLERAEVRAEVHRAVAELPDQYRTALTRKYVDGESLDTVAGELGISSDAAKSLLARARRALRDRFAARATPLSEAV